MSFLRTSSLLRGGRFLQARSDSFTSQLSGIPDARLDRVAKIQYDGRPANQNGVENAETWIVTAQPESRWKNSVMGWKSSDDPIGKTNMTFKSLKAAQDYCESLGMTAKVINPKAGKPMRPTAAANYAMNFVYEKPNSSPFDEDED